LIGSLPAEGRVVAIADWYTRRMSEALHPAPAGRQGKMLKSFVESDARTCATFQDYRRMFDRADLAAVMFATPDHHHVLAAMLACQAGLDVYVEKALSLTIAEGRRLVTAVRRYGRVCQVGSQNRSMETNRYGCRLIRRGGIGAVSLVEVCNYTGPLRYEGLPAEEIPEGGNWDLFCGPTPQRPYHWRLWLKDQRQWQGRYWRGWDMWRSYSGHLMTNWGAHSVDMVQSALGTDDTGPVEVWPLLDSHRGERRTCPVAARYANGIELRFVLGPTDKWAFHGERGKALMRRNQFRTDPPDLMIDPPDFEEQDRIWQGVSLVVRPHIQNWLDCIKTRDEPNAPVAVGHRSVTICHLAGIARELGRRLQWDPASETFPHDEEANRLLDRPRRQGWELPEIGR
jgi:predicted dehydrogenase